jgi:hypothetical protein
MAARRESNATSIGSRRQPAKTPEAREQQLIAAAVDRAEQQLLDGTASAQVITHYLKLGSSRERLEQQRLEHENQLTAAKIEAMSSQKEIERLYGEALAAMSAYSGREVSERPDE